MNENKKTFDGYGKILKMGGHRINRATAIIECIQMSFMYLSIYLRLYSRPQHKIQPIKNIVFIYFKLLK